MSNYATSRTIKPPSEGELSVTSGILGRINKWKNESSVRRSQPWYSVRYVNWSCYSLNYRLQRTRSDGKEYEMLSYDTSFLFTTPLVFLISMLVKATGIKLERSQSEKEKGLKVLWNILKINLISATSFQGIFKDKSKYPTLTRMSYCQCRLRLVFSSIFKEFGWSHVALILDRSDLFSWTVGKNLEYGLRKEGLLKFVRELDGNSEDESYHLYLRDASMYARGKCCKYGILH